MTFDDALFWFYAVGFTALVIWLLLAPNAPSDPGEDEQW